MDGLTKVKCVVTAVATAITSCLGALAIPLGILFAGQVFDYATGIAAAPERDEKVSSYKSILGIKKKLFMYVLVFIGWAVDILVKYTLPTIPVFETVVWPDLIAIFVTCWLIFNEFISILENLDDLGVHIPPFLLPLMKMIRGKIEEASEFEDKESES